MPQKMMENKLNNFYSDSFFCWAKIVLFVKLKILFHFYPHQRMSAHNNARHIFGQHSLSLFYTHTHKHIHTLSHILSLSHTHTFSLSHTNPHSHTHTHPNSLPLISFHNHMSWRDEKYCFWSLSFCAYIKIMIFPENTGWLFAPLILTKHLWESLQHSSLQVWRHLAEPVINNPLTWSLNISLLNSQLRNCCQLELS